jgi:transposase
MSIRTPASGPADGPTAHHTRPAARRQGVLLTRSPPVPARPGIKAVIPEPFDQTGHRKRRGSRGGRPVACHTVGYKRRAGMERGINVVKQWRGIATRYDCEALTDRGAVVLAAILTWLR